jgi:toxin ParE1/3/4
MTFNLIISDPANADLEITADYLAANYGLSRSDTFIDGITARMKYIAQFPRIGRSREELLPGLRSLPYPPYLIFYRIQDQTIEIVRIASGYQDLTKLFVED